MDPSSRSVRLVITDGLLSALFYFLPALSLAEPDLTISFHLLWHFTQLDRPWTTDTMVFDNVFFFFFLNSATLLVNWCPSYVVFAKAVITHQAAEASPPPSTMKMFFCGIIKMQTFATQSDLVLPRNRIFGDYTFGHRSSSSLSKWEGLSSTSAPHRCPSRSVNIETVGVGCFLL